MTDAFRIERPYLLFLGAVQDPSDAKTAFGLSHWAGERCLAQVRCAVGKKYAALAIQHGLPARGADSDFRATGQTGILIAGAGICIDAVVADFISGAAEALSPSNAPDHWNVIEGQGTLFHPSYAGVSLGLLHGSQPDAIVVCHDPGRKNLSGLDHFQVPTLGDCIAATVAAAKLTNPRVRAVAISLNTSSYSVVHATALMKDVTVETRLPCMDPLRFGAKPVVDHLVSVFP